MTNFPLVILGLSVLTNPTYVGVTTTTSGLCIITAPTFETNIQNSYSVGTNGVELWRGPIRSVTVDISSSGQWTNARPTLGF